VGSRTDDVLRELDSYRTAIREAFDEGFGFGASKRAGTIERSWEHSEARQTDYAFAHTRMSVGSVVRRSVPAASPSAENFDHVPTGEGLRALTRLASDLQRRQHDEAVAASPLFSVLHWKHNAGPDWPEHPDDDSYVAFENCVYPDCKLVRDIEVALTSSPDPTPGAPP